MASVLLTSSLSKGLSVRLRNSILCALTPANDAVFELRKSLTFVEKTVCVKLGVESKWQLRLICHASLLATLVPVRRCVSMYHLWC